MKVNILVGLGIKDILIEFIENLLKKTVSTLKRLMTFGGTFDKISAGMQTG